MSNMNFDLKFDNNSRIVYETIEGLFTSEYYLEKYHQAYIVLKKNSIKNNSFAKLIDMTKYIPSNIGENFNVHATWLKENNCTHIAMVVSKAVTTMQMNRVSDNNGLKTYITDSVENAKSWLAENGYK